MIDHVAERDNCPLLLTILAFVLKLAIGISGGHMLHWIEIVRSIFFVIALSLPGFTVPSFVSGLILVSVFQCNWGWLPSK